MELFSEVEAGNTTPETQEIEMNTFKPRRMLWFLAAGISLVGLATWHSQAWLTAIAGGAFAFLYPRSSAPKTPQAATPSLRTETLELQLSELRDNHKQLKQTYATVAALHREQKSQLDSVRGSSQILTAALLPREKETPARLLRTVMDSMEAGGGVLWLPDVGNDCLRPQVIEGRISTRIENYAVPLGENTSPEEIRLNCDRHLRGAMPPQTAILFDEANAEEIPAAKTGTATPAVTLLLREPTKDGANEGTIFAAIGLCDARRAIGFTTSDLERLQALAAALSSALFSIEERVHLERRLREVTMLYDLHRLMQSAGGKDQVCKAVVNQIHSLTECDNCTLFLLDRTQGTLEAKATKGRVVNLLDQMQFERGTGVSGWVAAKGRQVHISDLAQEPSLNVASVPPRVRSFAAIPMRVQNQIVGVINVSDGKPGQFSEDDCELLSLLAEQAAVVIEHSDEVQNLEMQALTDPLTGVANRRYFHKRLEEELRRARRYKHSLGLLMIDIDHFKKVNDHYGHSTGDTVLQGLANLLRQSVRDTEIAARYGGEEFALLMPLTSTDEAEAAAERIRKAVFAYAFTSPQGKVIPLTVSIGVASFPTDCRTVSELVEVADRALYAAKNGGRNQVCRAEEMVLAATAR